MPSLVHNMTLSPVGYGPHPSRQTQAEAHSKQPYASQSIQLHSAMHIEVLGSAWRYLGTSRGLYRVWTNIHGQVHMITYGSDPVYGPLEVHRPSKHITKHPRTLCHVY